MEAAINSLTDKAVIEAAKQIKLLLVDVDGVLTDGRLYYGNNGEELKAFDIQDGLGIKLLQRGGVQVGIITGRVSTLLQRRADELGMEPVVQGREDKLTALKKSKPVRLIFSSISSFRHSLLSCHCIIPRNGVHSWTSSVVYKGGRLIYCYLETAVTWLMRWYQPWTRIRTSSAMRASSLPLPSLCHPFYMLHPP